MFEEYGRSEKIKVNGQLGDGEWCFGAASAAIEEG